MNLKAGTHRTITRLCLAMLALLTLTGCGESSADEPAVTATHETVTGDTPYEQGLGAYQAGDFAKAAGFWRPAAEQDDPDAQYGLGLLAERGALGDANQAEAAEWYQQAWGNGLKARPGRWLSSTALDTYLDVIEFDWVARLGSAHGLGLPEDDKGVARLYADADHKHWALVVTRTVSETAWEESTVAYIGRDLVLRPYHAMHELYNRPFEMEHEGKQIKTTRGKLVEFMHARAIETHEELLKLGTEPDDDLLIEPVLGHPFHYYADNADGVALADRLGLDTAADDFTPYLIYARVLHDKGLFAAAQGTLIRDGEDLGVLSFFAQPDHSRTWRVVLSSLSGSSTAIGGGHRFALSRAVMQIAREGEHEPF